eukprot:gb/GEZN01005797.1/.p1 GENE.gb/GEZN01005797.1/~~gb/GEZN01005797.1/.p1  ORF type:complete len:511 (+),score=88.85 gb/GEZN01005797.1/:47-1579(+)
MALEVDSQDVIKLISQFLKENGLLQTLRTLQEESQVQLNTVDDIGKFNQDILRGNWDAVLEVASTLALPAPKLYLLFEQIVVEMAELREVDTARAILRTTPCMLKMKKESPERYLRLEHLLQRTYFDPLEAYPEGGKKELQRQRIAAALKQEVEVVPPARLLSLLTQGLKWQRHQGLLPKGSKFDLFRGEAPSEQVAEEEKFPNKNHKVIKFGAKSHAECAVFSPDGQYLVTGSTDGFIEVWDFQTGKLEKELKYQTDEDFMMHDHPVLCLAFSPDSELLASGDAAGTVKVWRIQTGACVRKFPAAHSKGISTVCFAKDSTQLLTASFDNTLRIHGLKSGRTLKEFRGHASYVTSALYGTETNQVISSSADGSLKIWNQKTGDCVKSIKPMETTIPIPVLGCQDMPKKLNQWLVGLRNPTLRVMAPSGQTLQSFTLQNNVDLACFTTSPRGTYVYAVGEDKILYCFKTDGGTLEHALKLHAADVLGFAHHPHRNIMASFSRDGSLKLWRP